MTSPKVESFEVGPPLAERMANHDFASSYGEEMRRTIPQTLKTGVIENILSMILMNGSERLSDQQCRSKLAKIEGMTDTLMNVFELGQVAPAAIPDVPAEYADPNHQSSTEAKPQ